MTPKEKAKELVDKYFLAIVDDSWSDYYTIAKECALIAVDEILNQDKDVFDWEEAAYHFEYWMNVKQEIEKL